MRWLRRIEQALTHIGDSSWRIRLPLLILPVTVLALLVALISAQRVNAASHEQLAELNDVWSQTRSNGISGSNAATLDGIVTRLDSGTRASTRAARWTLALTLINILLVGWLVFEGYRASRRRLHRDDGIERREQAAILKLLDEMAPLASGDLRVRATVSEAMTGSLADAFNYAVSELRWLVGTVSESAGQISQSVAATHRSAAEMAHACNVQAREIHRSSNYLSAMSGSMAQLSVQSNASARMATETAAEAASAAAAIESSVQRLVRIRDEADMTTQLMQRLAENTQAIDERVAAIRAVAKRTDLLALNTTIRAAAGASAGTSSNSTLATDSSDDLGRLSDEVAELADVLGAASRDIVALTRTIAHDAGETVRAMQDTNHELAAGLEQAEQACNSLDAIRAGSRELQEVVAEMAGKAVRQSGVVKRLSNNMGVINRITQDTASSVRSNAKNLDGLQSVAVDLRQGVADFRLPVRPPPPAGAASSSASSAASSSTSSSASSPASRSAARSASSSAAGSAASGKRENLPHG